MSTSRRETARGAWDDDRDDVFFRATAHLFTPQFCLGATVLLASYDEEAAGTPDQPGAASPVVLRPRLAAVAVPPARGRAA